MALPRSTQVRLKELQGRQSSTLHELDWLAPFAVGHPAPPPEAALETE